VLLKRAGTCGIGVFVAAALSAGAGWAQFGAPAAGGAPPRLEKVVLSAAADHTAYLPGETVRVAARLDIAAGWHLQAHVPTYDYLIPTTLSIAAPADWPAAELDYPAPGRYKFAFAEDELDVLEGRQRIVARLAVPPAAAAGPVRLELHLRDQACDDRQCLPPVDTSATVDFAVGPGGVPAAADFFTDAAPPAAPAARPASTPAPASETSPVPLPPAARSLPAILLLALLGGFILNGMPCVLPILSLKLFGLVQASGKSKRSIRIGALATTAGILASFWALAGTAVLARQAGAAIGWGVQFQQPGFVAFLTVVVLLFSLNLWGLFEIPLPARLARLGDAGASAGAGDGLAGHFASGLFATLMATPCSAPFLGTALSFALGQSGGTIFAVLTAVGAGLALPYLLLAAAPAAAKWMPRPGTWMLTLRGVMGFLLAGAVVCWSSCSPGRSTAESRALRARPPRPFVLPLAAPARRTGAPRHWHLVAARRRDRGGAHRLRRPRDTRGARPARRRRRLRRRRGHLDPVRPRRGGAPLRHRPARLSRRHRRLVRDLQSERAHRPQRPGSRRGLPRARPGGDEGRLDQPGRRYRPLPRRARALRHPVLHALPAGRHPAPLR
jgi:cytochrome c biogenesis protein CcdA